MIYNTVELEEKIELVSDLQSLSGRVGKQSMETLCQFVNNDADDDAGYYTSKHLIYVHKIMCIYKRNKAAKNGSANEKFLFKKQPPLLLKLGLYLEE